VSRWILVPFIGVSVFLLVTPGSFSWQWPISNPARVIPGEILPGFSYRILPRSGERDVVTSIAPGDLVLEPLGDPEYHGIWNSAIPRKEERSLYRHENAFWSVTAAVQPEGIEIAVWDGSSQRQVNPRSVLPGMNVQQQSGTAFLALQQDGEIRRGTEITAGEIVIALTDPASVSAALPREARILLNGVVVGRQEFFFNEDLGPVEIVRIDVPPGVSIFNVEYHHFDGTINRSTLRVVARSGP
jgi:hypothetical protein